MFIASYLRQAYRINVARVYQAQAPPRLWSIPEAMIEDTKSVSLQ